VLDPLLHPASDFKVGAELPGAHVRLADRWDLPLCFLEQREEGGDFLVILVLGKSREYMPDEVAEQNAVCVALLIVVFERVHRDIKVGDFLDHLVVLWALYFGEDGESGEKGVNLGGDAVEVEEGQEEDGVAAVEEL
jgi:hypothetical protein